MKISTNRFKKSQQEVLPDVLLAARSICLAIIMSDEELREKSLPSWTPACVGMGYYCVTKIGHDDDAERWSAVQKKSEFIKTGLCIAGAGMHIIGRMMPRDDARALPMKVAGNLLCSGVLIKEIYHYMNNSIDSFKNLF